METQVQQRFHRWFCSYMLRETPATSVIHYTTTLELAIGAIRGIIPRHISDPPRSSSGGSLPLEDQYQNEFYRSFYTLLDGRVLISPEYVAKRGKGGGTIDFLLSTKKWGFELLRNRNNIAEQQFHLQGQQIQEKLERVPSFQTIIKHFNTKEKECDSRWMIDCVAKEIKVE